MLLHGWQTVGGMVRVGEKRGLENENVEYEGVEKYGLEDGNTFFAPSLARDFYHAWI